MARSNRPPVPRCVEEAVVGVVGEVGLGEGLGEAWYLRRMSMMRGGYELGRQRVVVLGVDSASTRRAAGEGEIDVRARS